MLQARGRGYRFRAYMISLNGLNELIYTDREILKEICTLQGENSM